MKKILLSLTLIALMGGSAVAATRAYFTSQAVLGANTFSLGNVKVDRAWTQNLPINMANLAPGKEATSAKIGVGYGGTINADLYVGMKAQYGADLKSILDYYIEEVDQDGVHLRNVTGWASIANIFSSWNKVASDVSNGSWKYYVVHVRVHTDAQNSFQSQSATNQIIIYATQTGVPSSLPSTAPWETTI